MTMIISRWLAFILIGMSIIIASITYRSSSDAQAMMIVNSIEDYTILPYPFSPIILSGSQIEAGRIIGYTCDECDIDKLPWIQHKLQIGNVPYDSLIFYSEWVGIDIQAQQISNEPSTNHELEFKLQKQQNKLRLLSDSLEILQSIFFKEGNPLFEQRIRTLSDEIKQLQKSTNALIVATEGKPKNKSKITSRSSDQLIQSITERLDNLIVRSDREGYIWNYTLHDSNHWIITNEKFRPAKIIDLPTHISVDTTISILIDNTQYKLNVLNIHDGSAVVEFPIQPDRITTQDTFQIILERKSIRRLLLLDWIFPNK